MTEPSTESLIAESRKVAEEHDPAFRFVLTRVIDRLEEVAKDSAEGQYQHAHWQQRAEELTAVIEKVRAETEELRMQGYPVGVLLRTLAAAPADVLRERDAALIDGLADEYADSDREQTHGVTSVLLFLHTKARQRREERDNG